MTKYDASTYRLGSGEKIDFILKVLDTESSVFFIKGVEWEDIDLVAKKLGIDPTDWDCSDRDFDSVEVEYAGKKIYLMHDDLNSTLQGTIYEI